MERRPSNSSGISKISMTRRKRLWRDEQTTTNQTTNNTPPDNQQGTTLITPPLSPIPTPVLAVAPITITPLQLPVSHDQIDIQSLLSGQLSSETRRAYKGDLKHFLAFIKHPEALDDMSLLPGVLSKVDRQMATAYRDHMMLVEKRSAATVNRRLTTINTVFSALCEEGIVVKNPFSWVKRPKVGNVGKTPAFTKEQTESIISQPDVSTPLGKRDRIILLLLFFLWVASQ